MSPEPVQCPQQSRCLGKTLLGPRLPHHCRPDPQFHIKEDQVPGAGPGEGRVPPSSLPRVSLNPRSKRRPHPQASLQMGRPCAAPLSPSPARDPRQPPGTPPGRGASGGNGPSSSHPPAPASAPFPTPTSKETPTLGPPGLRGGAPHLTPHPLIAQVLSDVLTPRYPRALQARANTTRMHRVCPLHTWLCTRHTGDCTHVCAHSTPDYAHVNTHTGSCACTHPVPALLPFAPSVGAPCCTRLLSHHISCYAQLSWTQCRLPLSFLFHFL